MVTELFFLSSTIVLAGIAAIQHAQRNAARREAARHERLARIGASVDGLAHDLSNLFTAIPYLVEEIALAEDDERKRALQTELEDSLAAGARLLFELQKFADESSGREGGSLQGVVRLAAAGLRYRGPKLVLRMRADIRYEPGELEVLELVRTLMHDAVEEAGKVERAVIRIVLDHDGLVVTYPIPARPARTRRISAPAGWKIRHSAVEEDAGRWTARLELARSGSK